MKNKLSATVFILTFNEEKSIELCLKSVSEWAEEIAVVDSYSTDRTLEIVRKYTDKVYQHPFVTQAEQLNWALAQVPVHTEWVIRMDADETVMPALADELRTVLPGCAADVSGFYVKRRVYFMGRWIRHGGYYPIWLLRIWRTGQARIEARCMDEHTLLKNGRAMYLKHDIEERSTIQLDQWINKHNAYAGREAADALDRSNTNEPGACLKPSLGASQEKRKRWIKENMYYKLPPFLRAYLYYVYRYIFLLGFLDGREGLVFHFLQGFWYRFLVDAKIYEARKKGATR